eukprot:TRINITY_DN3229_c0_g2_i1.p1 TRINITY_DN3229_c0_g2~~TRINITY_DN3229_c0_g2_i1.p1  ORF type:complete len:523 (-),score=118.42 TRINITY_DN3229_c0_g2_i1:29-1567(-)
MPLSLLTTSEGLFQAELLTFGSKYGIETDFIFFVRFFIYYLVSLPVCYFYRKFKTPLGRNLHGIFWGMLLTVFFISTDFIWLCGTIVILYFTAKIIAPKYGWLSNIIHLFFNILLKLRDHFSGLSGYGNDLSTFFMMFMAKSNMVGWALHDGRLKLKNEEKFEKLPASVKNLAMTDIDFLSYLHLMFHPAPLAAGPIIHPKHFLNWLHEQDGYYAKNHNSSSGTKYAFQHILFSFITLAIGVVGGIKFNSDRIFDEGFLKLPIIQRMCYIALSCILIRHKYYCGWFFAEAGNAMSGLGYTGSDEKGHPKYENAKNMRYWNFEIPSSARTAVGAWNIGVINWLTYSYHHRWKATIGSATSLFATNQISALWHGYHFGYYISFFHLSLISFADILIYKFMWKKPKWFPKHLFGILKRLFYAACLNFGMFPFAILEKNSIMMYFRIVGKYFLIPYYTYVVGLVVLFLFIGDRRREFEKKEKLALNEEDDDFDFDDEESDDLAFTQETNTTDTDSA